MRFLNLKTSLTTAIVVILAAIIMFGCGGSGGGGGTTPVTPTYQLPPAAILAASANEWGQLTLSPAAVAALALIPPEYRVEVTPSSAARAAQALANDVPTWDFTNRQFVGTIPWGLYQSITYVMTLKNPAGQPVGDPVTFTVTVSAGTVVSGETQSISIQEGQGLPETVQPIPNECTVAAVGLPTGISLVLDEADNQWEWTGMTSWGTAREEAYTVSLSCSQRPHATASFTVTVTELQPLTVTINASDLTEGQVYVDVITVEVIESERATVTNVTADNVPAGCTFAYANYVGTVDCTPVGYGAVDCGVNYDLCVGTVGQAVVTFTAHESGNTKSTQVTLNVTDVPQMFSVSYSPAGGPSYHLDQGGTGTFTVTASGGDPNHLPTECSIMAVGNEVPGSTMSCAGLICTVAVTSALPQAAVGSYEYEVSCSNTVDGTLDIPYGEVASLAISVGNINDPPICVLTGGGTPLHLSNATTIMTLNCSDDDGDDLAYELDCRNGTTGTSSSLSCTYTATGTYTFEWAVSDGNGGTDEDTREITVYNTAPTAAISGSSTAHQGANTTLTAVYYDADSDNAGSYCWDTDSVLTTCEGIGSSLVVNYNTTGEKTIRLQVTDTYGLASTWVSHVITVSNDAPTCSITGPATAHQGNGITLTAECSDPNAGDTVPTICWDSDGTLSTCEDTGSTLNIVFPSTGTFTVSLRGRDNWGVWSSWADHNVVVSNQQPTACIIGPASEHVGASVLLASTCATDPDGDSIVVWQWDVENDSVVDYTTQTVSHTYTTTGLKTVRLRVQDANGAWSAWTSHEISVGNQNPTVVPTITDTDGTTLSALSVTHTLSLVVNANESDLDGDNPTCVWTQTVGPATVLTNSNTCNLGITTSSLNPATTYTFSVTADDGWGGTATSTISFTVAEAAVYVSDDCTWMTVGGEDRIPLTEDSTYSCSFVFDGEVAGKNLSFTLMGSPTWATITGTGTTWITIQFAPQAGDGDNPAARYATNVRVTGAGSILDHEIISQVAQAAPPPPGP